jgi:hypothetical protein
MVGHTDASTQDFGITSNTVENPVRRREGSFLVPILKDDTEVFAPYNFRMADHPTRTQTMRAANAQDNFDSSQFAIWFLSSLVNSSYISQLRSWQCRFRLGMLTFLQVRD